MSKPTSITLNGVRLDSFSLGWESLSRPIFPNRKSFTYSPSAFDGQYDLSAFNPDNRVHYEELQLSGKISIANCSDIFTLQKAIPKVMQFLKPCINGKCSLVFDDNPTVSYDVQLDSINTDSYMAFGRAVIAIVVFNATPFPTDAKYPMWEHSFALANTNTTHKFPIHGDFYTRPVLEVVGEFSSFKVEHVSRGISLEYTDVDLLSKRVVLDFGSQSCKKGLVGAEVAVNNLVTGDFFELAPDTDANELKITVVSAEILPATDPKTYKSVDFKLQYRVRYMYGDITTLTGLPVVDGIFTHRVKV